MINLLLFISMVFFFFDIFLVILDNSGFSKGYGFVRFGSEDEMKDSLVSMNGYIGLGTKALKICNAVPKPKGALTPGTGNASGGTNQSNGTDFSQYYDPSTYWQNYASWQSVRNIKINIYFKFLEFLLLP